MLRSASYIIAALLLPCVMPAAAQVPGGDTAAVLGAAHRHVVGWASGAGREAWPGFRPDTIPHLFVLPGRGPMLFGWRGPPPSGWTPVADGAAWLPQAERGAASTGTEMEGRGVAQVVVRALDALALAGVAAHESFHVHQRASRIEGRRFGAGENSMLLARYPVFDVENEAGMAVEGALLLEALRTDARGARARAREFLAVRAVRQRALPAEMAAFEDAAELNEGLAEYALHRATTGDVPPPALRAALADLPGDGSQSIRLRFYGSGSAMAHLLDRIGAPEWKAHALANDLTLAEALAHAAGAPADTDAVAAEAGRRLGIASLRERAARNVASLRASRAARADGVLAAPGIVLRVSAERLGARINPCGFDPQNLLMVDERRLLHTRWLRACAGGLEAEFNTPVVEDGGSFTAAAGEEAEVRITIGGGVVRLADGERIGGAAEVRIRSPAVTLTAARADVERAGRMIIIHPLPRE